MYTAEGDTILHDGKPIAQVIGGDGEEALRIAGLLNIAERDEKLLDHLAYKLEHRNDE